MAITINGTTGIAGVDGSASTPSYQGADTNTGIFYPAADTIAFAEGGAEVARFDSNGNFGVGVTAGAPATGELLVVANKAIRWMNASSGTEYGDIYTDTSNNMVFRNGSGATERMRIDSSGYVGINTTTPAAPLHVRTTANNWTSYFYNSSASGNMYGPLFGFTRTPNDTNSIFLYCEDNTNAKCAIYSNGTVTNRTGTYNSFSDLKLKQDVFDANSQWNDIKNLRIVKYRLKDEVAADSNYPAYIGVIAQEVEQVSPGLVDNCPDFEEVEVVDEQGNITKERKPTGTFTKSVKSSIIYMKAVKALQEAMERIETLEAQNAAFETRLAALEAK